MKILFKWLMIILGSFTLIIAGLIAWLLISHSRYGLYESGGPLDDARALYDVVYYDIQLSVSASEETLDGFTTVRIRSVADKLDSVELDLIDNFDVSTVTLPSGELCTFSHKNNKLLVALPRAISRDDLANLTVHYRGKPTEAIFPPWIGGFNWSKDRDGNDWIGLSCQGEGAKIWMPCKDHPSDEPDSMTMRITVPRGYYCASNGVLREVTETDSLSTFHWATNYPINNYSITVNIGKFTVLEKPYVTVNGDTMPVRYYVLPQNPAKADTLLAMAVDMLTTYRKYFGEYPWIREKFAIVQTAYLGMEHQTINSYGNHYNFDRIDGVGYDEVLLHEMGHEWWGNQVTVNDWADFWIHEGICTYGEALYILDKCGEQAYHDYMQKKKHMITNKKSLILGEHLSEEEAYHGDIYNKGAYVMHTLRYVLGDSVFFPMVKTFASNPRYTLQNRVGTADFVELVNRMSGRDLSPLLDFYLRTTQLPEIRIDSVGPAAYAISIPNIDFTVPMEVRIGLTSTRTELGPKSVTVSSSVRPIVDESGWYLKKEWIDRSP